MEDLESGTKGYRTDPIVRKLCEGGKREKQTFKGGFQGFSPISLHFLHYYLRDGFKAHQESLPI